jgi:U3 small nucleolar RNA-associated protein 6
VQAIVKKRRQMELSVNRSGAVILDYLRYIEYEINLEALRQTRRKRLGVTNQIALYFFATIC